MSLNTQYVISAGRGLSLKTKEVGVEACREGRGADQSRTVGERDPLEEITPGVASYSALIRSRRRAQRFTFLSLLFISLTAAGIPGDDLHCLVFMYYNVDHSWRGNVVFFF